MGGYLIMKTFIVNKDGSTEIREIPTPRFSKKQALVKTIACGICGTDIKLLHHLFKGVPKSTYPLILGHEGVGEVVKIGADVKSFKIGDKVILPFVDADPELFGDLGSGWGALSEYAVVSDLMAYPDGKAPDVAYAQIVLPEDINHVDSVMIVTFREVLSSLRYFGIKPGDSVAVYGCGPVGLSFIRIMNLLGIKNVIAVDRHDEKIALAKKLGAEAVINKNVSAASNAKEDEVQRVVHELYPQGVKYVIDAIGSPAVVNEAMCIMADRGSVLCYGVPEKEEITIDYSKANYNWNVIFQQMPVKAEEGAAHKQVIKWIASGELIPKDFISDYFAFKDSSKAYQKKLDRKIMGKGIITF
jgi:L-iditol 2-dehydrogenase